MKVSDTFNFRVSRFTQQFFVHLIRIVYGWLNTIHTNGYSANWICTIYHSIMCAQFATFVTAHLFTNSSFSNCMIWHETSETNGSIEYCSIQEIITQNSENTSTVHIDPHTHKPSKRKKC